MNIGDKFNMLTAIRKENGGKWVFLCDCGNEKLIASSCVLRGTTKSCGCLHMYRCSIGANRVKHGLARKGAVHPLHNLWRGIIKRCYGKNSKSYKDYGDRGIYICKEWKENFMEFYNWAINNGYNKNKSIDRIDNNGPYSPENCRFSTKKDQARNRRSSRHVSIDGETKTVAEWADDLGVSYKVAYYGLVQKPERKNILVEMARKKNPRES